MSDNFGTRMKNYESIETQNRLIPNLPVYARIDGKSFSKFTKGLRSPYDEDFSRCMIETMKYLVEKSNALIGYTQSDEISLGWFPGNNSWFDGKTHKMTSVLASMASVKFFDLVRILLPQKAEETIKNNNFPVFDARVFNLPNATELANSFLWREMDASKNAISMAARSHFSHKRLQNLSGQKMIDILWKEENVNFYNYPLFFRRGTWARKRNFNRYLTVEELAKIPENNRPQEPVIRSKVEEFTIPSFVEVKNREEFLLYDKALEMKT